MAVLAAPTTKAAARPQIAPMAEARTVPPVSQCTPRLISKDTTIKTTTDKSTVPAILEAVMDSLRNSLRMRKQETDGEPS
jgi:hypothetical protein